MNCKVCGSSEFVTNDGITYCTECQSQIEETQTEVAVEPTLSRDIGSSGPKKTPTRKKNEYGDWITVECFNHILYMQVSSLIKLGASPKLKNTVLHIWSKYLQRCEIAFRTDYLAKNGKPLLGSIHCKRDLKILYGDKRISKRKRKKPEESDAEPSADEGPSNDNNDAESCANADTSVKAEDKCSKVKFSSHARKVLRKKRPSRRAVKKVYNMTLAKTLSICYLGLRYTEDRLSLLDLISVTVIFNWKHKPTHKHNWGWQTFLAIYLPGTDYEFVYEEKIPYVNLMDKLPSTMKLQIGDKFTFLTYIVPDAYSILKTSREIMHFIKLPEYKEPSVFLAATCLLTDLNLPSDLLPIIKKIIERYKEEKVHYSTAPKLENIPPEYQALASILVAMKMLFVLDDKFEIEHSKTMNKLNTSHPDRRYFVWKEWKEHSVVKEFLFLFEKPSYSSINNLDNLSANSIISKYPFTRLEATSSEGSRNLRDYASVQYKIKEALSDVVHIPSSNPNVPTSFPLRRAVKCFMEEWRTLPMFKETKEIDFTLLRKDFSSYSLSFNPLQFDEVEDELSHLLMTSLYLPDTSVNMGTKYGYIPITYCHEVICTTSSYWFLNWYYGEYGTSDITSDWLDKLPNSFKWLLNFFSKYAYCNSTTLYKEVAQMEKILFLERRNVKHNARNRVENKINVDF